MRPKTESPRRDRPALHADPLLLWEVGIVIILLALFIVLFLLPAANAPFHPYWFSAPVLAAGFFGVLLLDRKRRREGNRAAVRRAIEEEEEELGHIPPS